MKKIYILLCLVIVVISTSCKEEPSASELIKNNKEIAIIKFDQFYKCYELALTTPKVKKDYISWIDSIPPSVQVGESNVYQIGIESFKDLYEPLDIPFDGTRRREHADMAQLFNIDLSEYKKPHNYSLTDNYSYCETSNLPSEGSINAIKRFLNCRYLIINRIDSASIPYLLDETSYAEGTADGDILIFDLETARLIGGAIISAVSAKQMTLNEFSNVYDNLDADLEMNIQEAIAVKFRKLTPGIKHGSIYF